MNNIRNYRHLTSDEVEISCEVIENSGKTKQDRSVAPILCLSGFGCSNYNYELLKEYLSKGHQLVLVDNRGMGKSSDVSNTYSIGDLAKDAYEVMKGLGHEKFHVIGISMGGFIGQEIALRFSSAVLSLSLLCTTSGGKEYIDLPLVDDESLIKFHQIEEPTKSRIAIKATIYPELQDHEPQLFERIVELRAAHPSRIDQLLLQKNAVDNFLAKPIRLDLIDIPTLIMSGSNDRYVNTENSKILSRKIKRSKIIFIPKSDHLFFLSKARDVAAELNYFISSIKQSNIGVNV